MGVGSAVARFRLCTCSILASNCSVSSEVSVSALARHFSDWWYLAPDALVAISGERLGSLYLAPLPSVGSHDQLFSWETVAAAFAFSVIG
jgi:hypothetical protein